MVEHNSFYLGLILLGFCLIAFLIQTEVTQYLQKNLDFKNPYFILWFSHSFYILVYPLLLLFNQFYYKQKYQQTKLQLEYKVKQLELQNELKFNLFKNQSSQLKYYILIITLCLTLGAYLWYVAVGFTTMSDLTAIYNTSCFFAYLFSVLFKLEKTHKLKSISVALSILGVIIIAWLTPNNDNNNNNDNINNLIIPTIWSRWFGNLIGLLSAILIGLFEVLYKLYCTNPKEPSSELSIYITAYIGLITFLIMWLPIPFLHLFNLELFNLPTLKGLLLLMINALMGVVYNTGLMAVITLTSPVFASVGVMISIPLVAFVDSLLWNLKFTWNQLIGGCCIFLAFCILIKASWNENNEDNLISSNSTGFEPLNNYLDEVEVNNNNNNNNIN